MARRVRESDSSGATPLEDVSGLKIASVKTRKDLYNAEAENTFKATKKYFLAPARLSQPPLAFDFLLRIHFEMFCDVWDWAGKIRNYELSPGIKFYQIPEELQKLIGDYEDWIFRKRSPIEISAALHHRLVWIHPFPNGNGRWARFVANLYLYHTIRKIVSWPDDQLLIESGLRKNYIEQLRRADQGDLAGIIELHKKFLMNF